jgi:hypothetical protein
MLTTRSTKYEDISQHVAHSHGCIAGDPCLMDNFNLVSTDGWQTNYGTH